MLHDWLTGVRNYALAACVALACNANVVRAADDDSAELRKLIDAQQKQIEQLQQRMSAGSTEASEAGAAPAGPGRYVIDDASIKNIVKEYLNENPGAGMPPSVKVGYGLGGSPGFGIQSIPNPTYVPWNDESKVPFDLRIRGRLQTDYYYYKVNSKINQLTGAIGPNNDAGDFGQFEIKRLRMGFEGTAFSPNLRYMFELDAGSRGLGANINGTGTGTQDGIVNNGGNGIATTGPAARIFQAWVAYDMHPCCASKGCGCDCCDDTPKYAPTFSLIAGRFKPGFAFEEVMGSGNQQFVEYGITNWYFDSDNDNLAVGAGFQVKAMEDRFWAQGMIDNGEENQIAANQSTRLPGVTLMAWYDFGGTWDYDRKRWQLYGDCVSDVDYSCNPVLRLGGAGYAAWLDRRSIYGNAEGDRISVMPGAPNGTNVIGLFNGGVPGSGFSIDAVDDYRLEAFAAAKYRGFSLLNDWYVRDLDNFRGQHLSGVNGHLDAPIVYGVNNLGSSALTNNALFPSHRGVVDFGQQLQAGYFLIPKHLEVAARWCWINGESGDIRGNGTFSNLTPAQSAAMGLPALAAVNGVPQFYRVYNGAFSNFSSGNEYTVGVNYFFKRHNVKWQTDVGYYENNPANSGQSAAGFITGVNGYLLRTQIQLWF